jgi:cytoskeleton protein RodZ
LRLEFDEDAWVEVKDGSEKILISRMHTAGSLVRVRGKSPLLLTIGNARAVRLFDNGKQVNLERYTSADVARVKLN